MVVDVLLYITQSMTYTGNSSSRIFKKVLPMFVPSDITFTTT